MSDEVVIFFVGIVLLFIFVGLPIIGFSIMLNSIFSKTGTCYTNKDHLCTDSSKSECDGVWYDTPWKCLAPTNPRACYNNYDKKCHTIENNETCNGSLFKDIGSCQSQLK
jgi:hypothetical protein